ncbi:MAG: hypothetical protein INR69_17010 [Mucilaginibacter polytrichastri]|nr:hypothetical protein [Mucilaginibacter polytrichastri]
MGIGRAIRRNKDAPIKRSDLPPLIRGFTFNPAVFQFLDHGPRYKYIKNAFYEDFIERGSLKIGTVLEYRKFWEYNKAIGDHQEGKYISRKQHLSGEYTAEDLKSLGITGFGPAPGVKMGLYNVDVIHESILPEAYVYCVTKVASREAMEKFEADRCVKINDFVGFTQALVNGLVKHQLNRYTVYEIEYQELKYSNIDDPFIAYRMKPKQYEYQQETRIHLDFFTQDVWHQQPPKIVTIPEITKYLEPFDL